MITTLQALKVELRTMPSASICHNIGRSIPDIRRRLWVAGQTATHCRTDPGYTPGKGALRKRWSSVADRCLAIPVGRSSTARRVAGGPLGFDGARDVWNVLPAHSDVFGWVLGRSAKPKGDRSPGVVTRPNLSQGGRPSLTPIVEPGLSNCKASWQRRGKRRPGLQAQLEAIRPGGNQQSVPPGSRVPATDNNPPASRDAESTISCRRTGASRRWPRLAIGQSQCAAAVGLGVPGWVAILIVWLLKRRSAKRLIKKSRSIPSDATGQTNPKLHDDYAGQLLSVFAQSGRSPTQDATLGREYDDEIRRAEESSDGACPLGEIPAIAR